MAPTRSISSTVSMSAGRRPDLMVSTYIGNDSLSRTAVVIEPTSSAAGSDILLLTPPASPASLIQYRMLGGTLDLYFFSGPTPSQVIEQYSHVVGKPAWQNAWAFGYQQCRWGYEGISALREVARRMNDSKIPLEGSFVLFRPSRSASHLPLRLRSDMERYRPLPRISRLYDRSS